MLSFLLSILGRRLEPGFYPHDLPDPVVPGPPRIDDQELPDFLDGRKTYISGDELYYRAGVTAGLYADGGSYSRKPFYLHNAAQVAEYLESRKP